MYYLNWILQHLNQNKRAHIQPLGYIRNIYSFLWFVNTSRDTVSNICCVVGICNVVSVRVVVVFATYYQIRLNLYRFFRFSLDPYVAYILMFLHSMFFWTHVSVASWFCWSLLDDPLCFSFCFCGMGALGGRGGLQTRILTKRK